MVHGREWVRRQAIAITTVGVLASALAAAPATKTADAEGAVQVRPAASVGGPSVGRASGEKAADWVDPCELTGGKRTVACFTDPRQSPDESARIVQGLGSLTAQAKEGDTIRISMYHWRDGAWTNKLAEEIAAAKARGVDVRVIVDEDSVDDGAGTEFEPVKILRKAEVSMVVCDDTDTSNSRARAGSGTQPTAREANCLMIDDPDYYPSDSRLPMNHVKLFLFELGGEPIVAAGSSNMTDWDYEKAWNGFVRIRGDAKLHSYLTGYFDRLWANDWDGWDDDAARTGEGDPAQDGVAGDLPEVAYPYPRQGADPIADELSKVTACPSDGRVWVAISKWSPEQRTDILDQMKRVNEAGCDVRVIVSDEVDGDSLSAIRSALDAADSDDGTVRVACKLHHKDVLIDAEYDGKPHQLVVTGSNVWAKGSLLYSAELNLRFGGSAGSDDGAVGQFFERHADVYEVAASDDC